MANPTRVILSPPPADRTGLPILAGYSGGLDSTVLLHRLAGDDALRRHGLRAIHVHHGLHADADGWAMHCERECAALGIDLSVVRVEVDRDGGDGLEAAARAARHAAFASAMGEGEILALAHHLDDQAETFLLRALRASGDGLGAMQPWRAFAAGWLWRPLLDTPRASLHAYADEHHLRWIEDPSNEDDAHDRNFLRHRVMPLLRERWPHAPASLARSAGLQQASAALLAEGDAQALAQVRGIDPYCIDATRLSALPAPRRARVLRLWIAQCGLPALPAEGIARIERDLLPTGLGDVPEFGWRDAVVRRWRDLLWAERRRPALPSSFRVAWDGTTPLALPTGDRFAFDPVPGADASTAHGTWILHARQGGERIVLPGRGHTHSLKHALQDLGVPPWWRERLPLLSSPDGALLAAGDLLFSATFDGWARTTGRRLRWSRSTS